MPKFLCVKGILFFSFWQSVGISTLVAARIITKLGPYTDPEKVSVGLNDLLICVEMPLFAIAHNYAFSYKDFIDTHHTFVARMPMYYAFRDAFGARDVIEDSKATLRGEGMDYREFEPAEGFMHQGVGRDNRIRAGLRYSKGGKRKYWLPMPVEDTRPPGRTERVFNKAIKQVAGADQAESVHAPLLAEEEEDVVHLAPDMVDQPEDTIWDADADDGYDLPFGDIDEGDEELFEHSKKYLFGDYNYPSIDVSSESARTMIWDEEERVLRDERGAWFSPIRGAKGQAALQSRNGPAWEGYGAVGQSKRPQNGKGVTPRFEDDGPIIDHEQARLAQPTNPRDVSLKWTKSHRNSVGRNSPSTSRSQSQSPNIQTTNIRVRRPTPSSSQSGSSGSSPNTRVRSPPSMSRTNSRMSASASPVLPPDAVDLVVEDPHAAEDELARERRKGEPAVHGSGLRKVYRRGFVAHDEDGEETAEGEVEVEETGDADERRVNAGEEIAQSIENSEDDGGRTTPKHDTDSEWVAKDAEGVIARTTTPPLHAQVKTYHYDDHDDNPWA